jgi:hypothetical protein
MLQIITEKEDFRGIALEMVQYAVDNLPAQKSAQTPEILNGDQLAAKLDVTVQTLLKWRQKGKVPYLQLGSAVRYDLNKVLEALEVKKAKGGVRNG